LLLLSACSPPPAPHPLPFDPLPITELETTPEPFAAVPGDDDGTGTEVSWSEPYAPRAAEEWRVDGAIRAPVVVLPGACAVRRATDCACADDTILVASQSGTLTAFSVSGSRRWEFQCGAPISQQPVVARGEAIFVRCDDGTLAALAEADGVERWRVRRASQAALVSPPAWSPWSGLLFLGDDGMAAIHRSGAVAWSNPDPGPFLGRPAVAGRVVVFAGLDRLVHGLDAETGEERWRRWVVGGVEGGILELRDGDVVVATLYGKVYAFALPDGRQRWATTVGDLVRGRPAEGTDGTILVPVMDGALAGLDPESGALLWGHGVPAAVLASPLPVERPGADPAAAHVVLDDRAGFVYELAYAARTVVEADAGAGAYGPPRELWRFNVGLPIDARPALAGASLLVGLEDGRVVRIVPGQPACAAAATGGSAP
jgi:outer membrane protein assembly factor BamB